MVETAQKLFYRQGIRSTGIDAVLAASGVAKRTLYKYFQSKDELVIAALQRRDLEFMDMLRTGVPRLVKSQQCEEEMKKVMAYFDALGEWINSERFCGCMFINASAEYPRPSDPVHVICATHKRLVIQFIEQLLVDFKFKDTYLIALQLAVLTDGAIVNAHTTDIPNAAEIAKETAKLLLQSYEKS